MAKVGRNDPCPCGSGKKYKKCCEARDQLAARRAPVPGVAEIFEAMREDFAGDLGDDLDERTQRVTELIDGGQLDEAERVARGLEAEYPEEQVGAESLALVYEARGELKVASDHYRRAVAAMDALGDGKFCDCCRARMVKAARRLDPDGPYLELGRDPQ
jgi:hypothetical protein